jgi:hypothetical protein
MDVSVPTGPLKWCFRWLSWDPDDVQLLLCECGDVKISPRVLFFFPCGRS